MKIGVLTAMQSEFEQLAALLGNARECVHCGFSYLVGTLGANEIVLMRCGIGKVNAAMVLDIQYLTERKINWKLHLLHLFR